MRRVITVLTLALSLSGCSLSSPPFLADVIGTHCAPETYLVGLLKVDPELGLVIQDDQDVITQLMLRMTHSTRWSSDKPREVEVLDDDGVVLATTGRRYKIGGEVAEWFGGRFWACAEIFIPQ